MVKNGHSQLCRLAAVRSERHLVVAGLGVRFQRPAYEGSLSRRGSPPSQGGTGRVG
jgi:hypothetical protein